MLRPWMHLNSFVPLVKWPLTEWYIYLSNLWIILAREMDSSWGQKYAVGEVWGGGGGKNGKHRQMVHVKTYNSHSLLKPIRTVISIYCPPNKHKHDLSIMLGQCRRQKCNIATWPANITKEALATRSEWVSEWVSEINEWTSEWTNEWTNERTNERTNEWMNERASGYKLDLAEGQSLRLHPLHIVH